MTIMTKIATIESFETTRYGKDGFIDRDLMLDEVRFALATTPAERLAAHYVRSRFVAYEAGREYKTTYRRARRAEVING